MPAPTPANPKPKASGYSNTALKVRNSAMSRGCFGQSQILPGEMFIPQAVRDRVFATDVKRHAVAKR